MGIESGPASAKHQTCRTDGGVVSFLICFSSQIPLKDMILPLVVLDDTPYLANDPTTPFQYTMTRVGHDHS
jgi:hypothetical protein